MADPTKYEPDYSYTDYQTANPTVPLPAPQVDNDFAKIQTTTDETIDALADVRRSDGSLQNGIVTVDSLKQPEIDEYLSNFPQTAEQSATEAFASAEAAAASALAAAASAVAAAADAVATAADRVDVTTQHDEVEAWYEELIATEIPPIADGILHLSRVIAGVSQLVADNPARLIGANNLDAMLAISDPDSNTPVALLDDGSQIMGAMRHEVLGPNNLDAIDVIYGTDGKTAYVLDERGNEYVGLYSREPIGAANRDVVFAPVGTNDAMPVYLTSYGGIVTATYEADPLAINNMDVTIGTVGAGNTLGWGVTSYGTQYVRDVLIEYLAENNLNAVFAVYGTNNAVGFAVTPDSIILGSQVTSIAPDVGAVVWEDAGNIWTTPAGAGGDVQVTTSGLDSAPRIVDGKVLFRSTRNGSPRVYEAALGSSSYAKLRFRTIKAHEATFIWGQSNAVANTNAGITTTAPFPSNAFKLTDGPVGNGSVAPTGPLTPLLERAFAETCATGFAKHLLSYELDRTIILAGQGQGGKDIEELGPGGTTGVYEALEDQLDILAALPGGTHCREWIILHGEQDGIEGNTSYDDDLRDLLDAANTSVQERLGQVDPIVFLILQVASAAGYRPLVDRDTFVTPFLQAKACDDNDDMFMIGPGYFLPFVDHAHYTATSQRLAGEYAAKVKRKVQIEGVDWKPLQPNTFTVVGSTVEIDFDVPVSPIVFNTVDVDDPGDKGFVLRNSGGATITGVAITDDEQITITFSAPPSTGWVLSYAFHNGPVTSGITESLPSGPEHGCRGCVCDSDATLSNYTSDPMPNWLIAFKHTF